MKLGIEEEYEVLVEYSGGYFSTECRSDPPWVVLIKYDEYDIFALLMANQTPKVFVGLENGKDETLAIHAPGWKLNPEGSAVTRASHWTGLNFLDEQRLRFDVVDDSGVVRVHDYPFELVDCICKSYDGL